MPGRFQTALGKRVAALRSLADLTQAQLAEKVGVAVETVSRLERGVTVPGVETLARMAQAMGFEPYEILKFPRRHSAKDRLLDEATHELRRLKTADLQLARDLVAVVGRSRKR